MRADKKNGHFTFRTTAALLLVSAAFELFSITDAEPLFGEMRSGLSVGFYHLFYAVLLTALGVGLWRAQQWGYSLVFVTTVVYTLDKLQFILGRQAMNSFIQQQVGGYEEVLRTQGIDNAFILEVIVLASIATVLCWWGFALYTWWRRDYFKREDE